MPDIIISPATFINENYLAKIDAGEIWAWVANEHYYNERTGELRDSMGTNITKIIAVYHVQTAHDHNKEYAFICEENRPPIYGGSERRILIQPINNN